MHHNKEYSSHPALDRVRNHTSMRHPYPEELERKPRVAHHRGTHISEKWWSNQQSNSMNGYPGYSQNGTEYHNGYHYGGARYHQRAEQSYVAGPPMNLYHNGGDDYPLNLEHSRTIEEKPGAALTRGRLKTRTVHRPRGRRGRPPALSSAWQGEMTHKMEGIASEIGNGDWAMEAKQRYNLEAGSNGNHVPRHRSSYEEPASDEVRIRSVKGHSLAAYSPRDSEIINEHSPIEYSPRSMCEIRKDRSPMGYREGMFSASSLSSESAARADDLVSSDRALSELESGQGVVVEEGEGDPTLPLVPQEHCMPTTAKPSPNCKDTDLCLICGDRASGYHYNALSCEGCKGFFRRSITRKAKYACKYGGRCELDMWMRRRCQACRLRRCRDVGMREECLLSDKQCLARNARRQSKRRSTERGGRHSSTQRSRSRTERGAQDCPEIKDECEEGSLMSCGATPLDRILEKMCEGHRSVVRCLVIYQDRYELPSESDLAMLSSMKVNENQEPADGSDAIFMHMVEMTILVTRLVINFAKSLPGFVSLNKEDQVILLKGSASEVMMLRTARRYDPQTDTVVFGNGTPFSNNAMEFGGLQGYIDEMFEFSRGMSKLFIDEAEYALLTALSIFSVRPGLTDPTGVEQIQEIYLEVLLAYIAKRRPGVKAHLPRVLMKLVELRTLSAIHSQVLRDLKLNKKSLPPLISEYFNISD